MFYEEIKLCRICKSDDLKEIYNLGDLASCGYFASSNTELVPKAPLILIYCNKCGLLQLKHNYQQDALFRNTYGYRSGINETMKKHLNDIVKSAVSIVDLQSNDVVLDIGSNDCTLLNFYNKEKKLLRMGIDPTNEQFKNFYPTDVVRVPEFFSYDIFRKALPTGKAKIITSIAMFYDLPDPNLFVSNIASILKDDGIWVFEQSYCPSMIKSKSFDTICHEHLEYYGLSQIMLLLKLHKLKIFDVTFNDVNGGSFCIYACHESFNITSNDCKINSILQSEVDIDFSEFVINIEKTREKVIEFLEDCQKKGLVVHGYGASTKGNTLLQYCNVNSNLIKLIADKNPTKWGLFTPGTKIPIVSEEESKKNKPDYLFVLPWHFKSEFLKREENFRKKGGKLVFPLPDFTIL